LTKDNVDHGTKMCHRFFSFCVFLSHCYAPLFSWAVSTANAFSDRRCLAIRGSGAEEPRVDFSSLDVIACDKLCHGLEHCCRGCTGGYPDLAWEFIQKTGIVTSTCMPYNLVRQPS